ncbi:hypothetical protein [Carnimonas bestiolae]|uniref:hypothetical protein n=1 Tax=Carnimonas bestiolae TaxID=3402172 RepID=UPI003F4AEF5D
MLSSLSGCSFLGLGDSKPAPQEYTKQSMQIDTSEKARQAAAESPKKVGEQVCRDFKNKLWGDFVMVGKVGAIGEDYLMRVDLLRVQLKGQPKITQRGFAKTRWAMQNQWYSCKDPV